MTTVTKTSDIHGGVENAVTVPQSKYDALIRADEALQLVIRLLADKHGYTDIEPIKTILNIKE